MQSFKTFILALFLSSTGHAEIKRISSIYKDLSQSQKIYLHGGLISVLEFPQNIVEVRIGNPKSIKAVLSQVSSKELTLYLSQQAVEPTNLIVKSEKRFYVFDIIPSKTSHQDYVKISGSYGGPSFSGTQSPAQNQVLAPSLSKSQGRIIENIKMGGE
ncbi:MAG: hypothetical protein JSU04_20250 [Bdellovibrionales bacterium]|nr:hypothetical protein [Bdellovibrionales bacterium]